jgi:DNA replication and repair protein recF
VNFRSHDEFLLKCNKKTSLLIGENGSGKTSVLEAIYEALRGKSFKASDGEILKRGADFYRVEVKFCDGKKTVVVFDGKKKQFLVEDKRVARLPKRNRYPVVLFLPDDLHLVATSPIKRRAYFDRVLAEFDESYNSSLLKYEKSLKQRNELLKRYVKEGEAGRISKSDFFSWNILLAKYGLEIRNRRKQYLEKLNNIYSDVYHSIVDNDDSVYLKLELFGGEISEADYFNRLEAELARDLVLGYTGFGIHRDDFVFLFNEREADGTASRGELRSIILAMKFIEADLIFQETGKRPVVLLDDVFSELDNMRQKSLVKNFKDNQVIMTSVEEV